MRDADTEIRPPSRHLLPALGLIALAGCAPTLELLGGPGTTEPLPKSVAVLGFSYTKPAVADAAADGCVVGILAAGARPVERVRVVNMVGEHAASPGAAQTPADYKKLGQGVGTEGFIVGSLVDARSPTGGVGGISARLISASSGELMWTVNLPPEISGDAFQLAKRACRALVSGKAE